MASVQEYLNMNPADVQKMTRQELSRAVSALSSTANKRLQRLESIESGMLSPAYQAQIKTGATRFTAKGKNINQLRNEFKNVTGFLSRKTSTVSGFRKYVSDIEDATGADFGSTEELSDFLTLLGKVRVRITRKIMSKVGSDNVRMWIRQEMVNPKNTSDEDVVEGVARKVFRIMNDEYEAEERERMEREAEYGDVFYELDDDESEDLPF